MGEARPRYAETIDALLVLLDTNRLRMARTVLEGLGADVADAVRRAYAAGHADGQRDLAREITHGRRAAAAAKPKRHEQLERIARQSGAG